MKRVIAVLCLALPAAAPATDPVTAYGDQYPENPVLLAEGAINLSGRITLTPAFSPDGRFAWFPQSACAEIGPCPQLLRVSEKVNGQWQPSKPMPRLSGGRVDWPSVTPDGQYLLFSWSAPREKYADLDVEEDFDLYRLDLNDPEAVPEPLDEVYGAAADINRPRDGRLKRLRYFHNSTAPVITGSGDLYFWSERVEAPGERDIFVARRQADGSLQASRALPGPINSPARDNHAWVSPEGGLMFISYKSRGGEGSDDIFVSRKTDGVWSKPENLGAHLNGPASDIAAKFTPDKSEIVFTSTRNGGLLQVFSVPTQTLIKSGALTPADLLR